MTRHLMSPEELNHWGIHNSLRAQWHEDGGGAFDQEKAAMAQDLEVLRKQNALLQSFIDRQEKKRDHLEEMLNWAFTEKGRAAVTGTAFGYHRPEGMHHVVEYHLCKPSREGHPMIATMTNCANPCDACGCLPPSIIGPGAAVERFNSFVSKQAAENEARRQRFLVGINESMRENAEETKVELDLWGHIESRVAERLKTRVEQERQKQFIAGVDEALAKADPVCSACGEKTAHVPFGLYCRAGM